MNLMRAVLLLVGATALIGCSGQTLDAPQIEFPLVADPTALRLQVGEVASVRWLTRGGQPVQGLRSRTGDPSVATVDSLGRVVGRGVGNTVVRPDSAALLGIAHVSVLPRN